MDADVVVVGAGLAGLVATAELAAAGRRVVVVEQEPEASLGGQAHWSFGGLFLVGSPEQRRTGVGRRLLTAVAARGREEGYSRLVADVLTENTGMHVLLASVLPIISAETEGYATTLTADLRAALPSRITALGRDAA